MGIKHKISKISGEKGYASEWSDDHKIDGDIDFAGHSGFNIGEPINISDIATKNYVDSHIGVGGIKLISLNDPGPYGKTAAWNVPVKNSESIIKEWIFSGLPLDSIPIGIKITCDYTISGMSTSYQNYIGISAGSNISVSWNGSSNLDASNVMINVNRGSGSFNFYWTPVNVFQSTSYGISIRCISGTSGNTITISNISINFYYL